MKFNRILSFVCILILTLILSSCEVLAALFGDINADDFKDPDSKPKKERQAEMARQALENY